MKYSELLKTKPVRRDEIREVTGDGNKNGKYQWNSTHFMWLKISDNAQSQTNNQSKQDVKPEEIKIVSRPMGRAELADKLNTLGYTLNADLLTTVFTKYQQQYDASICMDNIIVEIAKEEIKILSELTEKLAPPDVVKETTKKDEETLNANVGADTAKAEELTPEPVQTPPEPPKTPEKPAEQPPAQKVQTGANPTQPGKLTPEQRIQAARLGGKK